MPLEGGLHAVDQIQRDGASASLKGGGMKPLVASSLKRRGVREEDEERG